MSDNSLFSRPPVLLRLLGFFGLVLLVALLGGLAGRLSMMGQPSVALPEAPGPAAAGAAPQPAAPADAGDAPAPIDAPLYFAMQPNAQGDWTAAYAQAGMAAAAGVRRYVVPITFTWAEGEIAQGALQPVLALLERVPEAEVLLAVDLNPAEAWLAAHPEARHGGGADYAGPTSPAWLAACQGKLSGLLAGVNAHALEARVQGYVLRAFENGQWYHAGGWPASPGDLAAFRAWLRLRYANEAALQQAWGDDKATFAAAALPGKPDGAEGAGNFLALPAEHYAVDAMRFTSAAAAEVIRTLAAGIKRAAPEALVLAPYGFSLELLHNDAGHFALETLLESALDGFVCPISEVNRGLGGAGGPMGPVDSARYHGKTWYLLDETRTGVVRNAQSGQTVRVAGARAEDVFHVQRRNFAAALVHGLGLFWSDPLGDGWLHDEEQWAVFGQMQRIYGARGVLAEAAQETAPDLLVVVDEASRFYQRFDTPLNDLVLRQARDAALRSGVAVEFCLLSDVLSNRAPPAKVYLFLNAFQLGDAARDGLHARLAREKASALWLYAPGYINARAGAGNIAKVTRMNALKLDDAAAEAGSVFSLDGQWLGKGARIGETRLFPPLFYIDDEAADVLAHYRASGRVSVAMRVVEEGWTSVYLAEPALTPALLREILQILELHLYVQPSAQPYLDTVHVGEGVIALHGSRAGSRAISLGAHYNVADLFDASAGWPGKESFLLPLGVGETRLLALSPL